MELIDKKVVLTTRPFKVEEMHLSFGGKAFERTYHRLDCPDWVNILPITFDRKALLIRQPRAGALKTILETPGGMLDPHEAKDPMMAAIRELEEETGFTSQRVLPLGSINPNPAIQNNKCHFFVALAATPNPARQHFPDEDERIEPVLVAVEELDGLVRTGQIDHALSALCIMLAQKYIGGAP